MDTTKIRLSTEEEALVCRTDWILTKNRIIEKIKALFASLQTQQQRTFELSQSFYDEELKSTPKISKGENYRGLPYLVLDYPRFFNKEDIFVIRSFFWWGNFFSTTLQLSGKFKTMHEKKIITSFEHLQSLHFHICINDDQWQHHFEADNYVSLHDLSFAGFEDIVLQRPFIKLSKKIPIGQLNEMEEALLDNFNRLITMLRTA